MAQYTTCILYYLGQVGANNEDKKSVLSLLLILWTLDSSSRSTVKEERERERVESSAQDNHSMGCPPLSLSIVQIEYYSLIA